MSKLLFPPRNSATSPNSAPPSIDPPADISRGKEEEEEEEEEIGTEFNR
jgi:hypothetical protein